MLNRGKICELNKVVNDCKSNIDAFIKKYNSEITDVERRRSMYSTDYFEEFKKEICKRYKELIDIEKNIALNKIQPILSDIESDVNEWLQESPNMDFINRIEVLKSAGIEVGQSEAKMLQKSAKGNYLAERTFYNYVKSQEENKAFIGLVSKEPTAEMLLDQLKSMKNDAEIAISYYCGTGAEQNTDFIERQDIVSFSLIAKATKDITPKFATYSQEMADLMLKDGEAITESEKKWLKEGIGYPDYFAKEKAESFMQKYPNSEELVASSEEYKNLLEQ